MESFDYSELPLKKCYIEYVSNFIKKEDADKYLNVFVETLKLSKKEKEGRKTALYGHAKKYKYALNDEVPIPWTPELLEIKKRVEAYTGFTYNVCLINYYKNGKDKFNFHSDKEELGNDIPLVSISLGAERKFYFRSQTNKDVLESISVTLNHGSFLMMGPGTHENYVHALPADNSIKTERVNLTFRHVREETDINSTVLDTDIIDMPPKNNNSNKTIVVNKKNTNTFDVYIGRPSKWGNPYAIGKNANRDDVIFKHIKFLINDDKLINSLDELKGKRICCFCAPLACHGDFLAYLADMSKDERDKEISKIKKMTDAEIKSTYVSKKKTIVV